MAEDLEQRVIDLEIHVAHQADTVETLSDVIAQQAQTIDKLMKAVRYLKDQMVDIQDLVEQAPGNQKPPHY